MPPYTRRRAGDTFNVLVQHVEVLLQPSRLRYRPPPPVLLLFRRRLLWHMAIGLLGPL